MTFFIAMLPVLELRGAIPIGTAAGLDPRLALVAAFLDMRLKRCFPAIALGVLAAGIIVFCLTYGVSALL